MTPSNVVTVGPSPARLLGTLVLGSFGMTGGVAGVVFGLSLAMFGLNWFLSSGWVIVGVTAALVICCCGALFLADKPVGGRTRQRWSISWFCLAQYRAFSATN
jgi:hypothetical protein